MGRLGKFVPGGASVTDTNFYVSLILQKGKIIGHEVSGSLPKATGAQIAPPEQQQPVEEKEAVATEAPVATFASVCSDFVAVMDSYRKFITLTLNLASQLSAAIAEKGIGEFVKTKGQRLDALCSEERTVYELAGDCYREFSVHNDEAITSIEGAKNLPEVMVIGLVSAYDAFLSQLLRVVLNKHEEIVLTSEKAIKFSELKEFSSIEEARASLIDREIESVIRDSHQAQFAWMEAKLSVPLRSGLDSWPRFVELCERRNLLTHTGGVVTAQYLSVCKAHGVDVSDLKIGSRLIVNPQYYSQAVDTICEIGVKLCHVFWRKFAKEDRDQADGALLDLGFNLIFNRSYKTAEQILAFGTRTLKNHSNDSVRRMMVINLANAIRLQKREPEAKKILDGEDWSASSLELKIGVSAVSSNVAETVALMKTIGPNSRPTAEDYRSWPVFRGMRTNKEFVEGFESVFGMPYLKPVRVDMPTPLKLVASEKPQAKIEKLQ